MRRMLDGSGQAQKGGRAWNGLEGKWRHDGYWVRSKMPAELGIGSEKIEDKDCPNPSR